MRTKWLSLDGLTRGNGQSHDRSCSRASTMHVGGGAEEVSEDICGSRYPTVYLWSEGPTRDVTHRQSVTTIGGEARLSGSDSWRGGGPS
jgi:hypothetical protein